MAPKKGFVDFDPIFGEAKSELHHEPASSSSSHPILFHAYAIDSSRLRIVATDFLSLSWDRVLTVSDLEDLRDDIGIGGTWSDFVDYLKSSFSTGEVKIVSKQERSSQLMGLLSSEREKNEVLQKQLDSLSFLSKRKRDDIGIGGTWSYFVDYLKQADAGILLGREGSIDLPK